MNNDPTKNRKLAPFLIAAAAVLLTVLIISSIKLISMYKEYRTAREQYHYLSDSYVEKTEAESDQVLPSPGSETEGSAQPEIVSPISVDFDALKAISSDIEGWLFCPETVINYPVVQCDNNDKYLHGYINGDYSISGSLFIDYRCARGFDGSLSIIYGHHMKDGSMLASICDYKNQSYYDEHPVMYINTPDCNYMIRLFSAFTTNADSDIYTFSFNSEADLGAYLVRMKSLSDFTCDINPDSNDKVVMLSTCTYEYDSARYVLFGVLEQIG